MAYPSVPVHTIGSIALHQLQGVQRASVLGRSSRGLFVRLDSAWVIFLAWLGPPGPLTLLMAEGRQLFEQVSPGEELDVSPAGLIFPPPAGLIALDWARRWQAPEADPTGLLAPVERRGRLVEITRLAQGLRPGAGWSSLLPDLNAGPDILPGVPVPAVLAIRELRAALRGSQTAAAAETLSRLIGLGGGLTPSGDDLTLGLLLAVRRWGAVLLPGLDRAVFIDSAVNHARQATTDLSASLIECAAQGQADPRLIDALDSLLTGTPGVAECAAGLAEWGNSSGLDALLGMSLVI